MSFLVHYMSLHHFNGLVQVCSISSALALEILQSCTKPLNLCYYKMVSEVGCLQGFDGQPAAKQTYEGCQGLGLQQFCTVFSHVDVCTPLVFSIVFCWHWGDDCIISGVIMLISFGTKPQQNTTTCAWLLVCIAASQPHKWKFKCKFFITSST